MARQGKTQIAKLVNPWKKTRVLILGGGFGDLYVALEFPKTARSRYRSDCSHIDTTPLAGPARSHRTGSVSRRP
jgi:hypothetical protein